MKHRTHVPISPGLSEDAAAIAAYTQMRLPAIIADEADGREFRILSVIVSQMFVSVSWETLDDEDDLLSKAAAALWAGIVRTLGLRRRDAAR